MTAISLTLQANDNLNAELTSENAKAKTQVEKPIPNKDKLLWGSFKDIYRYQNSRTNHNNMGASGSFMEFDKFVRLGFDADSSGSVTNGDVLIYDIFTKNPNNVSASGAFLDDAVDANTRLISGSVITTNGTIVSGNNPGDISVSVDMHNIASHDTVLVSFAAAVNNIPDGVVVNISNQALLTTSNFGTFLSDDPTIANEPADPTVIKAFGEARTLYNEGNTGDLNSHFGPPTKVAMAAGLERVSGRVGGVGVDFEDCFQFEITESRVINSILLESYQTNGGNLTTLFQVFTGLPPIKVAIGDIVNLSMSKNHIGFDLLGGRIINVAGIYSVCLVDGTAGQDYSLVIQSDVVDANFKNGFD